MLSPSQNKHSSLNIKEEEKRRIKGEFYAFLKKKTQKINFFFSLTPFSFLNFLINNPTEIHFSNTLNHHSSFLFERIIKFHQLL